MNEKQRVGIKNFKSVRYPGQIKLSFSLINDDKSAPQCVSSKGIDSKDDYNSIEKSRIVLVNVVLITISWILRLSYLILKSTIYLIQYLLKIILYIIYRVLTESIKPSCSVLCHPIRCCCYHYHDNHE